MMREFHGTAIAVGCLYVGFVGWSILWRPMARRTLPFRMIHMAFIFGLAFIVTRSEDSAAGHSVDLPWPSGCGCYRLRFHRHGSVIRRFHLPDDFGIVAILLLLEISRRIVDNTFTMVVVGSDLHVFRKLFRDHFIRVMT
jgi:hypothetical protein